jgi:LacI family transcriptional regulator
MNKKSTFSRLAKVARVSAATVSRLAAGNRSVDPAIRARVERAATKLGIDLHQKRKDAGRLIAFVLANRDVLHAFHSRVLVGAERYISDQRWELVFLVYRYSAGALADTLQLPEILTRRAPAQGVILAGVNSPNLLQALQAQDIPYSVLGNNLLRGDPRPPCDLVWSDDVGGAADAARHLVRLGHRAIWFVGNTRFPWFMRCCDGYQRVMRNAGLEPRVCDLQSDGHELGYLGMKSIFARGEPMTAVLAGSDEVASGAYQAIREAGLSVPEDMSVVGFNDAAATFLHPALTSVREFPEKLGSHLAEFILQRIKTPTIAPRNLTIPTQLVVRNSTAAPQAGTARPRSVSTVSP